MYEELFVKIVEISSIIHSKTLRGAANWIITSPEIASIFTYYSTGKIEESSKPFVYCGTVNNRWRLNSTKLIPKNEILIGYTGDSSLDSGYIYAPFVPFEFIKNESGRYDIITRYSKKITQYGFKFFAKLVLDGFA